MKIAIVHDWIAVWAGAEQCLARLLALYPDADLFALLDTLPDEFRDRLSGRRAHTTWLGRLPGIGRSYRALLPLMPHAIESLDLRGYDLVVSSSHAVAKGVRIHGNTRHLCYCYTPMRYAWDLKAQYLSHSGFAPPITWLADRLLTRLQHWDKRTAAGVHQFVAISHYIAERIKRAYGRDSVVVYPPVNTAWYTPGTPAVRGTHLVTAGRLVPYKRVDLMVQAMRHFPDCELRIIGGGPERDALQTMAPPNVHFLGRVSDEQLRDELRSARAFLFCAEEDFGIAPLEAQACGTPVIAYGAGAALETLANDEQHGPCAVFFQRQTSDALVDAIARLFAGEALLSSDACRANALRFSPAQFDAGIRAAVQKEITR
jgi:glycosyltransferase involved in cell wall biosynthesis